MALAGEWIPIIMFVCIVAAIAVVMYFRTERAKFAGGGEYQRLAEEAVRGQRVLLEEMQRMNATLKEIERLLKEV